MKSAVITGPTGAIGMALIRCLAKNKVKVYAVVRPDSSRSNRITESEYVKKVYCDLDNIQRLPEMIPDGAEVFYHFGWDGTFGNSRNNMHGQNLNVKYALDAVLAAKELGCTTFIGAGSQAEYGRVEGKLSSHTPAFPENGYGMAKLCAGQMTRGMCEQYGIRHIWTRILSIYGPYDGEGTLVTSTLKKLLAGGKPSCTAGEQQWDYLYSDDAANAMYLIGQKGISGSVYCIGSGKVKPLREYIECMRDAIDKDLELGIGEIPYPDRQVMYLCADISELEKDTGFVPQVTFDEGIRKTIEWCIAEQNKSAETRKK